MNTYKAAIYRDIGDVDVVDLPYPVCGEDDVIVRNILGGICGSDVQAYRAGGDSSMIWKDHEFGHEAVSEIVEIGANVVELEVGDRVFVNQGQALRDMNRMATVGGFSNYIRIPQCEIDYSVIKIDKDIPLKTAVLFEPFTIGARAVRGIDPGPGKSAVVFGAGIIGIASAVMLRWYGCEMVMVVDYSDFRLEKVKKLGLLTCNPGTEDLRETALAALGVQPNRRGDDLCAATLYVDCVGVKAVIDDFVSLAPRGASLAIVGVHHEPIEMDLTKICFGNWHIHGCGDLKSEEMARDILAMMRSGQFDLSALVTHEYPVEQINDALVMAGRTDEAQKVCIAF